jgi:hypothetical protein
MRCALPAAFATLAFVIATPLQAAEWRLAAGIFMFSGVDAHLSVRPQGSGWQLGVRALRYTEEWETAAGTSLSKTTTTKVGPQLNYLFSPEARGSWYLGASVLRWTQQESSPRTGTSGRDETTAPFFGGGYSGRLGGRMFYNLGILLSPAKLSTQTADSAEETTGADIQLQFGLAL